MTLTAKHRPEDRQADDVVDVMSILGRLFAYRVRIIIIWVLVTLLTSVGALCLRPKFQSAGALYLESDPISGGGTSSLMSLLKSDKTATYVGILQGQDLQLKVIRRTGFNANIEGPSEHLPSRMRMWKWLWEGDPAEYIRGLRAVDVHFAPRVFTKRQYLITFQTDHAFTAARMLRDGSVSNRIIKGKVGEPIDTGDVTFTLALPAEGKLPVGLTFEVELEPATAVIEEFRDRLSVESGGQRLQAYHLLHINFESENPQLSQQVVHELIVSFQALVRDWDASLYGSQSDFLNDQLRQVREEMAQAVKRMAEYQAEAGVLALGPQLEVEVRKLAEMEMQLRNAQLRLRALHEMARAATEGKSSSHLMVFIDNQMLQQMAERLATLRSQIVALRVQYKDDYPPLVQAVKVEAEVRKDFLETLGNYIKQADSRVADLQASLDEHRKLIDNIPEHAKTLLELERSIKVFEELHKVLIQQGKQAEFAQTMSRLRFRVADPPSFPIEPTSPDLIRLILVGSFGGLFLGLLAALVPVLRNKDRKTT